MRSKTEYLNSIGRGATFKEISKSIVENIEIPLPSLSAQCQIADRLDVIKTVIGKHKVQIENLDLFVKSRFVEMFGDGDNGIFPVKPMTDVCVVIDGDRGKNYPKQEEKENCTDR